MAYIPPHRRRYEDTNRPSPTPFQQKNSKQVSSYSEKINYAKDSITRWFVVPCDDDDHGDAQLSSFVRLKEFRKNGLEYMILVRDDHAHRGVHKIMDSFAHTPWMSIMEKIQQDLVTSFQNARDEMFKYGPEQREPHVNFRFGKVRFYGIPSSIDPYNMDKSSFTANAMSRSRRMFHTNVPKSFIEAIHAEVILKIGLELHEDAEYYHVKVIDKFQPRRILQCRCILTEAVGELVIYKFEVNRLRNLVVDISCLDKNMDLRLMLYSKMYVTSLTEDEKQSLSDLMKSAVIDSEVKGGLRWPLGKQSVDDRFAVVGTVHTRVKIFKNDFMSLKVRHADRFDYNTSMGEVSDEASVRVAELDRQLNDLSLELNPMTDMVRDALKLIWESFLCLEVSFA